ncbi:MAG: hypothetical protein K1X83_02520 [Oligoflexia bacterium]|nr:hypothetical protein [Oligoflexia bacterium]
MTTVQPTTLFALPKPMHGRNAIIQRNSIQSWTLLTPRPEILLFGKDEGVAELAAELGLRHLPEVAVNKFGTPIISDMFERAEAATSSAVLTYVNSDIILMDNFLRTIEIVAQARQEFLVVGRRWNLDLEQPIDFANPNWREVLRAALLRDGFIFPTGGMDFFTFSRGLYRGMPPFAIGRTAWDNWLVWKPLSEGKAVVDATEAVLSIHHNHDYSHIKGAADQAFIAWTGEEGRINQQLAGAEFAKGDLRNVTLEVKNQRLVTRAPSVDPAVLREQTHRPLLIALQSLVQALERGDLQAAAAHGQSALECGLDFRGLHHAVAVVALRRADQAKALSELTAELSLFPGNPASRDLIKQIGKEAPVSRLLLEDIPDLHESEIRALGAALRCYEQPVQVLDQSGEKGYPFFDRFLHSASQWGGAVDSALPLVFLGGPRTSRNEVATAWQSVGDEGLLLMPASAREVNDFDLPEQCWLIHFENLKVVPPMGATGGLFMATRSRKRGDTIFSALEEEFPDCLVEKRLSFYSSVRATSGSLKQDRAMLANYLI